MLSKINEATELLVTLQKNLIRAPLHEIYKCCLNYGDILFDQSYNFFFH